MVHFSKGTLYDEHQQHSMSFSKDHLCTMRYHGTVYDELSWHGFVGNLTCCAVFTVAFVAPVLTNIWVRYCAKNTHSVVRILQE